MVVHKSGTLRTVIDEMTMNKDNLIYL